MYCDSSGKNMRGICLEYSRHHDRNDSERICQAYSRHIPGIMMGNGLTYSRYMSEYSRHIDLVVRYMEYSRNMSEYPTSTDSRCYCSPLVEGGATVTASGSTARRRLVMSPGQVQVLSACRRGPLLPNSVAKRLGSGWRRGI